jgi:hypothetical protein
VSQAITNAGGHVDGPAGIGVDVKAGTFPDGAVVRVTPVNEASFPLQLTPEQRPYFSYSGGVQLDYGGKKPQLYLDVSIPAAPTDNEADRWIVVRAMPFQGETLFDIADTARVIGGKIATASPPCPGISAAAVYGFLRSSRQLTTLTGKPGVQLNPEAANTSYLVAAGADLNDSDAPIRMPAASVAGMEAALGDVLLSAPTFCAPVLSGRVGAVPNEVAITLDATAVVDADVKLTVKNNAPLNTVPPRYFFRPFPASLRMSGGVTDPIVIEAMAVDGTTRTIDPSHVTIVGRPFVVVEMASVVGDYRALVIENLRTHKQNTEALVPRIINGVPAGVNLPIVRLLTDGLPSDQFSVKAVTTAGADVPLAPPTVKPYSAGGGNMVFSALRGTIDPTPKEIDDYNNTLPPGQAPVNRLGGSTRAVIEVWMRDPVTQKLTHTGPDHLILDDTPGGVNLTVDGGFTLTFDDNVPNVVFYLAVNHLDASQDRAKLPEFRVTVVNHTTKATVRELLGPTPPPNDTTVINVYGDGSATPELLTDVNFFKEIDPSSPFTLTFSAPVERNSATTYVKLTDNFGLPVVGTVVFGTDPLNGIDSIVTFVPKDPLPLGQHFTLSLIGVVDLLGRPLPVLTISVTTFAPTVKATYTEANLDGTALPFDDMQVLHDNGPSGPRTTLFVTSRNDSGFKLHGVDVTTPDHPFEPPNAHAGGGHLTRRLALQTDTFFPLRGAVPPPCNTHVNSGKFFGHFAVGTASNTDNSSLMFYDVTNPAAPCTLSAKGITTNPAIPGDFQHGTFRTLNNGAGGAAILKTTTGYAAYMAIREVGVAAVDVGANIPDVSVPDRQTEGLYPGDYSDVVSAAGDRLLALNNNYGSGPTLDVLDPNLSPLASVAVDQGASSSSTARAQQIAYASNILVDKNGDGQYDDSEVFAFAYIAGRAGITVVDVTDTDNPVPVTTFPVGQLARQVAVSRDGRRLYVGGAIAGGKDTFYVIDVSNPFAQIANRILWQKTYPIVERIQIDAERPYVYVAWNSGLLDSGVDVIATEAPNLGGTLKYTRYPIDIKVTSLQPFAYNVGLNFDRKADLPIRGAVVELRDASDHVVAKTTTDDKGFYLLNAPANATLTLRVKAEYGPAINPRASVIGGGLIGPCPPSEPDCHTRYVNFQVRTGSVRITRNFVATSEQEGGVYSSRDAAPFAILDTAYEAESFVKAADPNISLPALTLDWAPGPTTVEESFYDASTKRIVLKGWEDHDTDEFDTTVILHEYGHYLMDTIGRSDSLGERHAADDRLDPPTAFNEGFADAFAGLVAAADPKFVNLRKCTLADCTPDGHTYYADTSGPLDPVPPGLFVPIDVNTERAGPESEWSVATLVFNFAANGHFFSTKTAIELMAQSPSFMSIYSYMHFLKIADGRPADVLAQVAALQGVGDGDEWGEPGNPVFGYSDITASGKDSATFDGFSQATKIEYPADCTAPGNTPDLLADLVRCQALPEGDKFVFRAAGNKLGNWDFYRFKTPADGQCYRLFVIPHGEPGTSTSITTGTVLFRQIRADLTYTAVNAAASLFFDSPGDHAVAIGSVKPSPTASTGQVQFHISVIREAPKPGCGMP